MTIRGINIYYRPTFVKQYAGFSVELKDEIKEKIDLFKDIGNHKSLKVHKLHGKLKGCYSFSINYRFRIVFEYLDKNSVALLTVGDHDIYK